MCGIVLNFDDDKVAEQAKVLDSDCQSRGLLVRMLGTGTMVLSPVSLPLLSLCLSRALAVYLPHLVSLLWFRPS